MEIFYMKEYKIKKENQRESVDTAMHRCIRIAMFSPHILLFYLILVLLVGVRLRRHRRGADDSSNR